MRWPVLTMARMAVLDCGQEIDAARLEAIPYAPLCLSCQSNASIVDVCAASQARKPAARCRAGRLRKLRARVRAAF